MDESRDLIASTYEYLEKGYIEGASHITPEQMEALIRMVANKSAQYLRAVSLPTIKDQLPENGSSNLPDDFAKTRALKMYAINDEPWTDGPEEYWFLEQNGTWKWVRRGFNGSAFDCATVTSKHLIDHWVGADTGLVSITLLRQICDVFVKCFKHEAERASEREKRMLKAMLYYEGMSNRIRGVVAIPDALPQL